MVDNPTAFNRLIQASRAALMDRESHAACDEAAAKIGATLKQVPADTAKIAELTEQLRVSKEERAYFEELAWCAVEQCHSNEVEIMTALNIPVPASIPRLDIVKKVAPED